jgi:hypothetical protein
VGQFCLEFVEAWLSKTSWAISDHACHRATYAVLCISVLGYQVLHAPCDFLVRASDGEELVHLFTGDRVNELEVLGVCSSGRVFGCRREEELVADGSCKADNFYSIGFTEVLLSNCASSDTAYVSLVSAIWQWCDWLTNGLAGTAPTPTRAGLHAVLLQVRPVRMAGSWVHVHCLVAVVLLPLVLVHDSETDRRAQCDAKLGTGLYLDAIFLITWGRYGGLARSSARHLGLDIVVCEGHAWRAAIDNGTNRQAMRLAIARPWLEMSNYSLYYDAYVVTLKCVPNVDIVMLVCAR